jgi:hypothetical protein
MTVTPSAQAVIMLWKRIRDTKPHVGPSLQQFFLLVVLTSAGTAFVLTATIAVVVLVAVFDHQQELPLLRTRRYCVILGYIMCGTVAGGNFDGTSADSGDNPLETCYSINMIMVKILLPLG